MHKNINLIVMMLICITILSTTTSAVDSQYITRAEATEKIVRYMYDLSYGEPFDINMTYCMHETRSMHFTAIVTEEGKDTYPLLASIYNAMGWNGFSDITPEHQSAIALNIAKEMGIINGHGDGTFKPDLPLTFGQTVKMLVCALGYKLPADLEGGYPNGYIKVADEIGALSNVRLDNDNRLSVQEFETLLKDFFALDYYPVKGALTNMPTTAEDCVRVYAEGVKTRNARVQYAVFGDELQRSSRSDFEERNWVTGVSSPWCTDYEIEKLIDTEYNVTFYYATSDGASGNIVVNITTEQFGSVYKITAVDAVEDHNNL